MHNKTRFQGLGSAPETVFLRLEKTALQQKSSRVKRLLKSSVLLRIFHIVGKVAKRHKTVDQVNAFNDDLGMVDLYIVVGEIPKRLNSAGYQAFGKILSDLARNAEHSGIHLIFTAEFFYIIAVLHHNPVYTAAYNSRIFIKHSAKIKSGKRKIDICGEGTSEVADAYEYRFKFFIKPQDFTYFIMEKCYIITVALLTESAEAVEILPYLRGGKAHQFGKLLRGDSADAFFEQFTQKTIITGKSAYNSTRNILISWQSQHLPKV